MTNTPDAAQMLATKYQDVHRHTIIAECEEWRELIPNALSRWAVVAGQGLQQMYLCAGMMRVLAETIYVLGYERGRRDAERAELDPEIWGKAGGDA